jgi:hypothetical protein
MTEDDSLPLPSPAELRGAMNNAQISSSTVGGITWVQIYGQNGPYSGFRVEKNRKQFALPSGSILNASPRDKFVAWNGITYELHNSAERILCDDSLLLIGQVKEFPDETDSATFSKKEEPTHEAVASTPPGARVRISPSIHCPSAARKLEAYLGAKGIGLTDFATTADTTDRTLRSFRRTGRVRRDIFESIARAMGTTKEELLKQ